MPRFTKQRALLTAWHAQAAADLGRVLKRRAAGCDAVPVVYCRRDYHDTTHKQSGAFKSCSATAVAHLGEVIKLPLQARCCFGGIRGFPLERSVLAAERLSRLLQTHHLRRAGKSSCHGYCITVRGNV